jgi:hypothetical protein
MRGDRIAEAGSKGNARGPPSSSVRAFALADWHYGCTLGEAGEDVEHAWQAGNRAREPARADGRNVDDASHRCGQKPAAVRVGRPEAWAALAPLLETRASMLLEWVSDDSVWEDIESS